MKIDSKSESERRVLVVDELSSVRIDESLALLAKDGPTAEATLFDHEMN